MKGSSGSSCGHLLCLFIAQDPSRPEALAGNDYHPIQWTDKVRMSKKINCWEFKKCGREPGGANVSELGVCPAAVESIVHGINDGENAGRACWAVTGTLCLGRVEGKFTAKAGDCMECDFYKLVCREQGSRFQGAAIILCYLKRKKR